jgi:hypothetical protein
MTCRETLEGLLGALRGARPPEPQSRLADMPWDKQLAALRAERAPLPQITSALVVANDQAALLWLDRATTAFGREPSTREILQTVIGGNPTKSELMAFTKVLQRAGALSRRGTTGRREPLWQPTEVSRR